ncbi:MAG: PhzF family phenazine biosynthesis protein [Bacteroidota bacterium]
MKLKLYQIDAFTDTLFSGNPAAVCPLQNEWLDEEVMQHIAMENNLAETAFYIFKNNEFSIRWFTPTTEVDLCGHATLATAYVLFFHENYQKDELTFSSRSGKLSVRKDGDFLVLNFPADTIAKTELTDELRQCFSIHPKEVYKGKTDYMLIFENEEQIKNIQFDLQAIEKIDARGIIITALGTDVDFVSRFFGPQSGIAEDPVTGSAHTTLVPYWQNVFQKESFTAKQISSRGGFLRCKFLNERIEISGQARTYLIGEIYV